MGAFFLIIIFCCIADFCIRKRYQTLWEKATKKDLTGLISQPIAYTILCYIFSVISKLGVAISTAISSLFDVDTYIGLVGDGWVGLALQWLRENGFIEDMITPVVVLRFNEVLSTIVPTLSFIVCIAVVVCIIYLLCLKKLNASVIYLCYYTLMGCSVIATVGIIIETIEFIRIIQASIEGFHMNGFIVFLAIVEFLCAYLFTKRFRKGLASISKQYPLQYWTWNQVKVKFHMKPSSVNKHIGEVSILRIIGVVVFISLLIIAAITLFQTNSNHKSTNSSEYSNCSISEVEDSLPQEPTKEEYDIIQNTMEEKIMEFYINHLTTGKYDWSMTTSRFYEYMNEADWDIYMACQDCPSIDVTVHKIIEMDNAYDIQLLDEQGKLYLELVWLMAETGDGVKLDNIIYTSRGYNYNSYVNTDRPFINYLTANENAGLEEEDDFELVE